MKKKKKIQLFFFSFLTVRFVIQLNIKSSIFTTQMTFSSLSYLNIGPLFKTNGPECKNNNNSITLHGSLPAQMVCQSNNTCMKTHLSKCTHTHTCIHTHYVCTHTHPHMQAHTYIHPHACSLKEQNVGNSLSLLTRKEQTRGKFHFPMCTKRTNWGKFHFPSNGGTSCCISNTS